MAHAILNVTGSTGSADGAGRGRSVRTPSGGSCFAAIAPGRPPWLPRNRRRAWTTRFCQPRRVGRKHGTQIRGGSPPAGQPKAGAAALGAREALLVKVARRKPQWCARGEQLLDRFPLGVPNRLASPEFSLPFRRPRLTAQTYNEAKARRPAFSISAAAKGIWIAAATHVRFCRRFGV